MSTIENIVSSQSIQIQNLIDLNSDKNIRSYDQTTKQNATISFNELTQIYRFEIQKNQENDMFMYQVWKKNNLELNSNRIYMYKKLRYWISYIFKKQSNFTPTTLIEINGLFYPTVMIDATIEDDSCVFYFKTSSITNPQGIVLNTLPKNGTYNNIRFDIDDSPNPPSYLIGTWVYPLDASNTITINSDGTIIKTGGLIPGTYSALYTLSSGYDISFYNNILYCIGYTDFVQGQNSLILTYSTRNGSTPPQPNQEVYTLYV